jgi:hypothetical protein
LILIGDIETNRNQTPAERMGGAYQCNLSTKLIRLTDGKELIHSDIFSVKKEIVVNAISKYAKDNKINFDESELQQNTDSLVMFYTLNQSHFNLVRILTCDEPFFDKEIPIYIIYSYFTELMKQQLQVYN